MPSTQLTSEQAFQLAQAYQELAAALTKYRFDNWNSMIPEDRQRLEDYEWTLTTYSSDFNQKSVILLLTAPKTQEAVVNIVTTTKNLTQAVKTLQGINKILTIATAAFTLGGAIISGNPSAIGNAIAGAISAVNS